MWACRGGAARCPPPPPTRFYVAVVRTYHERIRSAAGNSRESATSPYYKRSDSVSARVVERLCLGEEAR